MFERFFRSEAASGILLMAVTVLALAVANSPLAPLYFDSLHATIGGLSLLHWINDGLMALFFLLVGLEIRRELGEGELSTWPRRILPGLAALGGMAVPALIYVLFNRGGGSGGEALQGWAIPTATDIAFSLGVLALFGTRAPAALKIFLTALAIIDDLLAVLIIALVYGSSLSMTWLAAALFVVLVLFGLSRARVAVLWPYLLLGLLLWACVLKSGIHATLAGVILAFVMPAQSAPNSPSAALEHGLAKWVAFAIVPVFAFANAGVSLAGLGLAILVQPVTLGVAAGLFLGKQIGIFGITWAAVRLGWAQLPPDISWRALYGVSLLCGIGFTISLFIGALAFGDPRLQDAAKLGVLAGSLLSGLAGMLVLGRALRN
ncbi:MAG TPA: Na+/H+ antiporter NhaA [Rhizomicrobium sp.]|nr:Na+/H+ antiporter NhaA [Rhizomicrobium sp.]